MVWSLSGFKVLNAGFQVGKHPNGNQAVLSSLKYQRSWMTLLGGPGELIK